MIGGRRKGEEWKPRVCLTYLPELIGGRFRDLVLLSISPALKGDGKGEGVFADLKTRGHSAAPLL